MTYYVTRWWQTKGIVEMEGEVADDMCIVRIGAQRTYIPLHIEAFPSREAAEMRIKILAERKVEALRAQADRIERDWLFTKTSQHAPRGLLDREAI